MVRLGIRNKRLEMRGVRYNMHYISLICNLLSFIFLLSSCQPEKKAMPSVMFGQADEEMVSADYDLDDIQSAGELIAVTLSGPET